MKNLTSILLLLIIIFYANKQLFSQGECILVIQGVRDNPNEAFFKNSADNFVTGMGTTMPAPTITVLRPDKESSMLGMSPTRSEQNYSNEDDLKKKIAEALCKQECKNVVIALIGHGMGGNGITNPPPNKNAGGMKIGPGNTAKDYLTAPELARLIDSCKKSVKIIASQCFAESMINGICASILNKGLIGVAIGSSLWNEDSEATGTTDGDMTYEFLMNFLKNYYLIIGNPNAMEDIRKAAEELKKKNEEYNKKIAEENAARDMKIMACQPILAALKAELAAISKKIADLKAKIAKQKDKKATPAQTKELADLNKAYMDKNKEVINKEFDLNDLIDTPAKSPIPDHLPVMELVIHEAFKSAKSLTTSSTGVEPVTPSSTGPVDIPNTPPTEVEIKGNHFVFYKVIDKKTGKCVVVGYRADKLGNPIGPIKSIDCMIDCSVLKFSYSENGNDKVVEATKINDTTYSFKLDGQQVFNIKPGYQKMNLIQPGQLLEEAYCQILFNKIPEVIVPHCQVIQPNYNSELNLLQFILLKGNSTYQVRMQFMPHEDVMITIGQSPPYLASSTKRFTLLDESFFSYGKMGIIRNGNQITGSVQLCVGDQPFAVNGQLVSDLHRFILSGLNTSNSFQVSPLSRNSSLMTYNLNGKKGILHQDIQSDPYISYAQITQSPSGHNFVQWQYNSNHLSDAENEMFKSSIIIAYEKPNFYRAYLIPKEQNTWEDPFPFPQQTILYKIFPVVANNVYCVAYHGILYDKYGMPVCLNGQSNTNFNLSNRNSTATSTLEKIIVYPNPFNEITELHFSIESDQQVQLRIFNASGSLIDLKKVFVQNGWNAISITKEDLKNPGLYFYELKTKDNLFKGKLVLE